MTVLIADTETDDLLPKLTRIWTIQLGDAETEEVTVYADQPGFPPIAEAVERIRTAERVVLHHGIGFDWHVIERFYPGALPREKLFDTLIAARLFQSDERDHTLRAWGERLKLSKGDYTGDFKAFDEELVTYAAQDIRVTRALYHKVREVESWGESCALEHKVAWIINAQVQNGFCFNTPAAESLYAILKGELADMEAELVATFPPIERSERFTPKVNNKARGYVKGVPFVKKWTEPFNPASRQQAAERLTMLGWKPKDYGKSGVPTLNEAILAPLPWPEAQTLARYFGLLKRLGQLAEGDNAWLKLVEADGRIHGQVNTNGAVTGRMSHYKPNITQSDRKDPRMRALFGPRPGWVLVGCDAEGLEARMLAHYLARYDNGAFGRAVLEGRKEDASDVHSLNRDAIRKFTKTPIDRDGAKTELYALIYGARDPKLGQSLIDRLRDLKAPLPRVPVKELGALVRMAMASSMKGLDKLTEAVTGTAKTRGYLRGIDGRHMPVRAMHAALNTLLQGGGAIVMKRALVIFWDQWGEQHGKTWGLCASVHDEVQMEADPAIADALGQSFADAIRLAGEHYALQCPLAGKHDIGPNWAGTH